MQRIQAKRSARPLTGNAEGGVGGTRKSEVARKGGNTSTGPQRVSSASAKARPSSSSSPKRSAKPQVPRQAAQTSQILETSLRSDPPNEFECSSNTSENLDGERIDDAINKINSLMQLASAQLAKRVSRSQRANSDDISSLHLTDFSPTIGRERAGTEDVLSGRYRSSLASDGPRHSVETFDSCEIGSRRNSSSSTFGNEKKIVQMLDIVLQDMTALNACDDFADNPLAELQHQLEQETEAAQQARDEVMVMRAQLVEQEMENEKLKAIQKSDSVTGTHFQKQFLEEAVAAKKARDEARAEAIQLRAQLLEQQAKGDNLRAEAARSCTQLREWAARDAAAYTRQVQNLQKELAAVRNQLNLQQDSVLRSNIVDQGSIEAESPDARYCMVPPGVELVSSPSAPLVSQPRMQNVTVPQESNHPIGSARSANIPPSVGFKRVPNTRHSWSPASSPSRDIVSAAMVKAISLSVSAEIMNNQPPMLTRELRSPQAVPLARDAKAPPVVSRESSSPRLVLRSSSPKALVRAVSSPCFLPSTSLHASRPLSRTQSPSHRTFGKISSAHQAALAKHRPCSPPASPRITGNLRQPVASLEVPSLERNGVVAFPAGYCQNVSSVATCKTSSESRILPPRCPCCGSPVSAPVQSVSERGREWLDQVAEITV